MKITVDKHVPVPKPKAQFKGPLDQLEIGESFRVPLDNWPSLRNAVGNQNRRTDRKYTVRKVTESVGKKEREFARVWRVE